MFATVHAERQIEIDGQREWLPSGLGEMAPGPELADALASVDRSRLNGHDLVVLLQARARQLAHDQAELYADMVEIAHCPQGGPESAPDRVAEIDEFAADEIRAALVWTRRAADAQLDVAHQLRARLPRVWEALHEGRIDAPRARVIVDNTCHLDEATARMVIDVIAEDAEDLTTGQLAARIRRLCLQVDPAGAKERYDKAVADRQVAGEPNPDGTANIHGTQLPADRVAAVMARIDHLAKSHRSTSDPRSIDEVRADVFLDLLEGRHPHRVSAEPGGMVGLRVDLATLARLADLPGEIDGWGPVIADVARQIAQRQPDAEWRVTVTDPDDGRILHSGITRRRPTVSQRRRIETLQPTCLFPGCRIPARGCDLDHTRDYASGGPTIIGNLGPLCRHDHRLKHDGGWRLRQPRPGHYVWTSRLGHTYTIGPHPP